MVPEKWRLEGKVAIVTGGGTGIGKAIVLALARGGADVVVAGRRVDPVEQTAREVKALGRRGLAIPTDVTDSQQVNRLVERTLSEMGRIDILVNNAGGSVVPRKAIWDITDEEWQVGINTNLTSAFFCCRAVGKHLVAQRSGKVINIASVSGLRGGRDDFMYACSKGGVIQLTRSLALTWARDNIQVNAIAPGPIDTSALQPGATAKAIPSTEIEKRGQLNPVGRRGVPEDISSQALFFASDASNYITGAVFAADGGIVAGEYAPAGYIPIINMEED